MPITTIDPSTKTALATYETASAEELERALGNAFAAANAWGRTPVSERAAGLARLASALRQRAEALARLATSEMGKPFSQALDEIEKCAVTLEYYAEHASAYLRPERVPTEAASSHVEFSPLGVVLAIMPWNFPYWQVIRAAAPILAGGNAVLLKHAENTTGCGLALAEVALESGLPPGLLTPVVIEVSRVAGVIDDLRVAAVTLTGSTRAGRAVASAAGRALKKTVLELGGSDPFVVLADADLDAAAAWAVRSRFQNAGQSCIAAKRLILEEAIADAFVPKLLAEVSRLRLGDPLDPSTTLGPLAREDLRAELASQVARSVAMGATLLTGGRAPERPGFFYEPTVLDRATSGMPVVDEEVFGPALPVLRARNEEEAIALANASRYGLGGAVWTADVERGRAIASRLASGHTAVNGMTASDARLPFGGIRNSGYGRELSHYGVREFVNAHTVVAHRKGGPVPSRLDHVE